MPIAELPDSTNYCTVQRLLAEDKESAVDKRRAGDTTSGA